MPALLFVYDDLMRGRPDDGLLAVYPHRVATMHGHLHRRPGGRPVLAFDPAGPPIEGELVQLAGPEPLTVLDALFGTRDGPIRREQHPALVRGAPRQAEVYVVSAEIARLERWPALKTTSWRPIGPGGSGR